MKDIAGRVAFITGGASGMGLGMARVFSAAGMKIVMADVRQDHLDAAMQLFRGPNPGVHAIRLDVADRTAMARAAAESERVFGKIHVLCNNAGVGIIGPLLEASYDDWDWAMGVNLGGVFNGIREFVPRMRAHGEGGHVVTTASMGGLFAAGTAGIYNTSKYAAVCLMESLRPELASYGIGVSAFCPGLVHTNIHDIERTRPAQYAHSGYTGRAAELAARAEFMKTKILPAGMDPMEVGERVLRGIRRNDLYILTHPEYEAGLRERFEAILASMPLEGPPPATRVAAEAVVLSNPLFVQERERQLRGRLLAATSKRKRAAAAGATARRVQLPTRARTARSSAQAVKPKPKPNSKRSGAARGARSGARPRSRSRQA
jgi:NAD(P)-dependent dehydrogenase (short-subunit alcohol dehydrogenase family)